MAGRGMGAATKGGGCVGSGSRNKMTSKPSSKVAVMMKDGGMAKKKFPDLTGDGKVTKKDILKGRGVKIKAANGMGKDRPGSRKMAKPVKKMGGGMMKKYKKGGYAGCK